VPDRHERRCAGENRRGRNRSQPSGDATGDCIIARAAVHWDGCPTGL
jgi:hypothetical protein